MDISKITEELFIGTTPYLEDYPQLHELGIRLVINMRIERPPFPDPHKPSLEFLWLPTIDHPFFPIPTRLLMRGAQKALEVIRDGGRVLTHCAGGRHRGVAMGAAVLVAQGYAPEAAMQLIKERRPIADPGIFYIRRPILRFAHRWQSSGSASHLV
jgi:protein tyrosine phosphatase (PTP) superfamily phosphohydrolase (DUF442 family)